MNSIISKHISKFFPIIIELSTIVKKNYWRILLWMNFVVEDECATHMGAPILRDIYTQLNNN